MFVKIQTWFPFNIQVYINGRELMKSIFDKNNISYQCYDNSFTDISDVAKAQEPADKFDSKKLSSHLDAFARSINPFLDTVKNIFGQGYYWCVNQCGFATDVMFQERRFLDAMVDIVPARSTLEEIGKVCSRKKTGTKTVTGFNVWSPEFVLIMETVCDGRFLLSGFCNKEICSAIFPNIADEKKIIHSLQLKQHNFSDWLIVLITSRNTFGFHVVPNFKFS